MTSRHALGRTHWAIPEGYIPEWSHDELDAHALVSHEAACILNASDQDAHIELTLYFSDREPVGPYLLTVPARRTLHQRFNDLRDPAPVPTAQGYASVFVSDVPVVVQHTRLDSRQAALALLSTIAYSEGE